MTLCGVCISGNTAHTSDNSEIPASAGPAGSDITIAGILWYPIGPGTAQQVRVFGAVSYRAAAGTQTAAGEVAQRGQGAVL